MPHADTSLVPADITTKPAFYSFLHSSLQTLLEEDTSTYWVSNLANASALLYHAYLGCQIYGVNKEDGEPVVNWAGFYLRPPPYTGNSNSNSTPRPAPLLLGPFNGRPACQLIPTTSPARGVCAAAFLEEKTMVVRDVEEFPGHIACDASSRSEIVLPLRRKSMRVRESAAAAAATSVEGEEEEKREEELLGEVIGVLDIDSTVIGTFDDDDRQGLERIVELLAI